MEQPVYLDYSATTPVDERVLTEMLPSLRHQFGNPASRSHAYGWAAERAVELLDSVGIPDPRSRARSYPHELSGGMRLEKLREYASTGANYISVGALTHSAVAVDINFRVSLETA